MCEECVKFVAGMKKILILNGANLNRTGQRSPRYYGTESFDAFLPSLQDSFANVEILYSQHNGEGDIIDALQAACDDEEVCGVVINPGAYSHYSLAIADALADAMEGGMPVVEVHLSNIAAREDFRHHSVTGARCKGVIAGLGLDGYRLAVQYLTSM